ncbi:hypothetical protein K435DRAFT_778300 [Dendrothele bispora CBS 962.96]|uniref:receptor protein-tyrosine kinase n=1 Tax=Dendrothele bispora (strain CBS 962.96) TaxID=1314807 RepID=A0A4S8M4I9_DENBC|nr:hypothetical protein K435DRAFT_778300 [Dendrothele bispora CBS 962.96]
MSSILLILLLWIEGTVHAQRNITVQEVDPLISYNTDVVDWGLPQNNSDSASDPTGDIFALTARSGAVATFTFTGTDVYYFAPLWPMRIFCRLSLDGGADEIADLEDYSVPDSGLQTSDVSKPTGIRWSKTGLENKTHQVLVKVGNWAVVEHFVYTTAPSEDVSSASGQSSTDSSSTDTPRSPSATTSQAGTPASSSTSTIVGGVVGGVLGLVLCGILVAFLFCRRRRHQVRKYEEPESFITISPFVTSNNILTSGTSYTISPTTYSDCKSNLRPPPYTPYT